MIDAKRNLVTVTREMIIDHENISWFCLNTRDNNGDRLYSDGINTLTKVQIKELGSINIPDSI